MVSDNTANSGSVPELPQPKRYTELDSMRGLASLTVFFSHFVMGNVVTGPVCEALRMSPAHILWDGASAVLFFFILSGFVLALPYINNEARPVQLLSFYLKRIFRIFPAYIAAILLSVALKHWLYDPHGMQHYSGWLGAFWKWHLRDNLIPLANTLLMLGPGFNTDLFDPVIWSLGIEMRVSFVVPFLISIIRNNRVVFNVVLILTLTYIGIEFWITMFYAGILLAKYNNQIGAYITGASKTIIVLLFVSAVGLYTWRFTFRSDDPGHYPEYMSAMGSCLFIMLALHSRGFSNFLKNSICQFLGKVSYSFYLVHLPVLITVASLFPYKDDYSLVPVFAISLSLSFIISFIMYKCLETPFQQLAHSIVLQFPFWQKIKFM